MATSPNDNGKKFPAYKAKGTTVMYAVAVQPEHANHQADRGKEQGRARSTLITDAKGLPGKTCGAALLGKTKRKLKWTAFPAR